MTLCGTAADVEGRLERLHHRRLDALVRAAEDRQHGAVDLGRDVGGAGDPVRCATHGPAVEADHAREVLVERPAQERQPSAHAEPDCVHAVDAGLVAQRCRSRRRCRRDCRRTSSGAGAPGTRTRGRGRRCRRSARSSRWRSRRCRSRRTGARGPRRRRAGRGRRAGSRSPRRSARRPSRDRPRSGCRRRRRASSLRASSAPPAIGGMGGRESWS